jgi:signal transduction histidine kinase
MLDLPAAAAPAPPHWHAAPMPGAALYQAQAQGLVRADGHDSLAATPGLLAALARPPAADTLLLAWDSSGAPWRLGHAGPAGGPPLWRVQALADSRAGLLERLRSVLGRELAGCVLHELRGPLNALSLHADLLARLLGEDEPEASLPRALNSAEVIRERLRELRQRQDSAVALWLERPEADGGAAALARLVGDSLRLLRGYLALHEVRLRSEALEAIGTAQLPRGGTEAQLALLGLLVAGCAGARRNRTATGEAEVLLVAGARPQGLCLEIQAPFDGQPLGRELAGGGHDGRQAGQAGDSSVLAALALLLEPSGLRLEADAALGLVRLTLPA